MTWQNSAITITTFLPILGAIVIICMPKEKDRAIRGLAILFTGAALGPVHRDRDRLRLRQDRPAVRAERAWIPVIGVRYHVGIDGISLPLYLLTFLLSFLCAIYSWKYVPDAGRTKAFLALMLLLETGMAGTFVAFDLILFFVFWEMVLVPMYFLIGIWGSDEPRVRLDQVLPVHAVRLRLHAAGLPRDVLQRPDGGRRAHVRHDRAPRPTARRAASATRSS